MEKGTFWYDDRILGTGQRITMQGYSPRVEMLVVKKMLKDNAIGSDRSSGQTNLLIGPDVEAGEI